MATKFILSNFCFLISIVIFNFPHTIISDGTCPYPCYPPPTGTGTPAIATPSPPTSQSVSYPPPAGSTTNPSPTGNFPYYAPPPPFGNNYLYGQPPPDPILPYFPFYYRKPPHQTEASSAIFNVGSSAVGIIMTSFTLTLIFFLYKI